jgi:hypothetical protein
MRDIYLLHKSIQQEVELQYNIRMSLKDFVNFMRPAKYGVLTDFVKQLRELFVKRRNRNPLISSSIAALAQQLCGSEFVLSLGQFKVLTSSSQYLSILLWYLLQQR